ncbi:Indole-3-glycerol phosphate synthase [uncultured archaeon]|nr:Indole-3-glycerol phosphate synthase [uncultured archaeon]
MQLPSSILQDIQATVQSGYYERLAPVRRERKSVCEAIERELAECRLPVVLEVATARPGGRLLLPNRLGAAELVERMALLKPTAMSVWVEPRHMAGDLRWLGRPRPFPVIARDLVLDARQIVGGDAVVLSRSLLTMAGLDEHPLIDAAHDLDMEVVMEVRTPEEMERARASEADVVAIHNAGANGGGLDINTTLAMLSAHRTTRPVISCAGIRTPAQVRSLISAGASGVEVDAETSAGAGGVQIIDALRKAVSGKTAMENGS